MFKDRLDAAGRLVRRLQGYRDSRNAVVLAIPRGGLPIGARLARELGLRLDVILIKKIGHPENPECAIGAVSLTASSVDEALVARGGVSSGYVAAEVSRLQDSLRRRSRLYRGAARPLPVQGKTVILTDDGAATGRTLLSAVELLRRDGAGRIVVAIPVAPPETVEALERAADEVVCLETPGNFMAIGQFYDDFSQVPDEEVVEILKAQGSDAFGAEEEGGPLDVHRLFPPKG